MGAELDKLSQPEIDSLAFEAYEAVLQGYALTYNVKDNQAVAKLDKKQLRRFLYNNRILSLLNINSLLPHNAILNNRETHNFDYKTHDFYGIMHTVLICAQSIIDEGIWDGTCSEVMAGLVNTQLEKLPKSVQQRVQQFWETANVKYQDLPTLDKIMLDPEKYNSPGTKQILNLIDNLSLITFLKENPSFDPKNTADINSAGHQWLTKGNEGYQTIAHKIETIDLTRAIQFEDSDEGQAELLVTSVKQAGGLNDETFYKLWECIKDEAWWQNYLNFWNQISPLNRQHEIVMLKLLAGQYAALRLADNSKQIEADLEGLFKLINFRIGPEKSLGVVGAYQRSKRDEGKHVVDLNNASPIVVLHEVTHTVNGHFPVGQVEWLGEPSIIKRVFYVPEMGPINSKVARLIKETCSCLASDILRRKGDLRYSLKSHHLLGPYVDETPKMEETLQELTDKIPRDPAKFIAFMDEFNNLLTLIWDRKVTDAELVTIFRELLDEQYDKLKEHLRERFPKIENSTGFRAIGQRDTQYETAPKAGLYVNYRQLNNELQRIMGDD